MQLKTTFILVFVSFTTVFGQNGNRFSQIDSLLTNRFNQEQFSGAVIITENDSIKYSKTFGFADAEQKIPITLSTQFDLSSGAKLFTAVAIAQLAEKGKINFNDRISDYFPELPYGNKITIHQLLTHSSGLGNFQSTPNFNYENVNTCTDVLPFIKNEPLNFNSGDSVLYATSNLLILGAIIENVTGLTFHGYVGKYILEPLELKRTTFDSYFNVQDYQEKDGRYARGYIKNDKGIIVEKKRYEQQKTFVTLSSGGMWASASDLLKFDQAIHSGKLFSKDMLKIMTTKYVFSGWEGTYFGYVFNVVNVDSEKEGVGHAGNSSGHHCFNFHYKNRNTTLIILTNYGFVDIFELAHGKIEVTLFD